MEEIIQIYKEISNPQSIVEGMSRMEFIQWLSLGTVKDIQCALAELVLHHMFDYAAMARNYLIQLN